MGINNLSTKELVDDQSKIGKEIEDVTAKYPKGTVRQDQVPDILKKLVALDANWIHFPKNHKEILTCQNIDGGHEHFQGDYRSTIEKLVAAFTEMINAISTRYNPKNDLINRRAIGTTNGIYRQTDSQHWI